MLRAFSDTNRERNIDHVTGLLRSAFYTVSDTKTLPVACNVTCYAQTNPSSPLRGWMLRPVLMKIGTKEKAPDHRAGH
jgi:hypothetical protein